MIIALMGSASITQSTEIMFRNVSNYNLNIIFDTFKNEGHSWVPAKKIIILKPKTQSKMEHVTSFTITATTATPPFHRLDYTFKGNLEYMNKIADLSTLEINVDPKAFFFSKPIQVDVIDYNPSNRDFFKDNAQNNEE
jgi:hypothetical protein